MFRPLSLIAATTYATLLVGAGAAYANGDPPSNVLVNAPVYVAEGGGAQRLTDTVDDAGEAGYDVKVAVIGSPRDLGNIPQYWGQPDAYAQHLAEGLRFAWRGDLLIVMPGGLGLAATAQAEKKKKAALAKIRPRGSDPDALAAAGTQAVRALAKAAGRPIGGSGGASVLPALLVLGGLLLLGGGAAAWRMRADPQAPGREAEGEPGLEGVDQRTG